MRNQKNILTKLDTVISRLKAGSNASKSSLSDIKALETIRQQCQHENIKDTQVDTDTPKNKEQAIIQIGIEMDYFEEHLRNIGGHDQYTTTAQAFRQALEKAYDAGIKASSQEA